MTALAVGAGAWTAGHYSTPRAEGWIDHPDDPVCAVKIRLFKERFDEVLATAATWLDVWNIPGAVMDRQMALMWAGVTGWPVPGPWPGPVTEIGLRYAWVSSRPGRRAAFPECMEAACQMARLYVQLYHGKPRTEASLWAPHLAWLKEKFAGRPFFVTDVLALAPDWVPPPGNWAERFDDASGRARSLGRAYAKAAEIEGSGLCIQQAGSRNRIARWVVAIPAEAEAEDPPG